MCSGKGSAAGRGQGNECAMSISGRQAKGSARRVKPNARAARSAKRNSLGDGSTV
jgi:hypothetical protein